MAKKPGPRDAVFTEFEKPVSEEVQEFFDLVAETSAILESVKRKSFRSLTEIDLEELADVLRRGASPQVEFEPDMTTMAIRAAEQSRQACVAALEILAPRLEQVRERNERSGQKQA